MGGAGAAPCCPEELYVRPLTHAVAADDRAKAGTQARRCRLARPFRFSRRVMAAARGLEQRAPDQAATGHSLDRVQYLRPACLASGNDAGLEVVRLGEESVQRAELHAQVVEAWRRDRKQADALIVEVGRDASSTPGLRGVVDGIRIARRINARLGAMLAEELTIRAGALSPGRIWRRRTLARPNSPFRPRRIAFRPTGWTRSASLRSAFIRAGSACS